MFDDHRKLKRLLKQIKKDVGIKDSADIFHPAKFLKDGKLTPYISPHYHLITFGWIKGDKVKEVYEKYGIVIKKIRTIQTNQIFRLVKYLLTHAGVKKRTHVVVYTGSISYSKLKLTKEIIKPLKCPYCPLELSLIRIMPQYLDKPPPFTPDFVGLTDFSYLEYIIDYDFHYYDNDWNVTSTKITGIERKVKQEKLQKLQLKKLQLQKKKSNNIQKLELWL